MVVALGAIHKGRPADPGEWGLRNSDVPLLFDCDSIVSSGRRGRGSRNPGYSRMSFENGPQGDQNITIKDNSRLKSSVNAYHK